MADNQQDTIIVEGQIVEDTDSSITLYDGGALVALGAAANDAASQGVFADYAIRRAANTLKRQAADLALFGEYLAAAIGEAAPTGEALRTNPDSWQGVTWGLVEGFKRWQLQQGYAVGSVNVRLSTVKTYAKLATKAGVIGTAEYTMIKGVEGFAQKEYKRVNEKRHSDDIPTRVGAKKIAAVRITPKVAKSLKSQPDTPQGRRDSLLMCLLLDHGLRCGEVAALDVTSIDLKSGELRFYRPKVDKLQTHKLTGDTLRAAHAYIDSGEAPAVGNLLRASQKGGKLTTAGMSERAITKRVGELGKAAGVSGLSSHDCRHYWATHAARSGTDGFSLMTAGGWTSMNTVKRYIEAAEIANEGVKGF